MYDLGIRNSILRDFRPPQDRDDRGSIYESFVFLTLLPILAPNMELRFWRTKKGEEVDLVLVKDRQPFPIEVKARWEQRCPPPGVLAFSKKYSETHATFTVSACSGPPVVDGNTTHHFVAFEDVGGILARLG
jgi:hypothetical protein